MGNILLKKPISANSFFAPYAPERAVNGTYSYYDRWIGTTVPAWLQIDLQGYYWVNRWRAYFMGYVTWERNYNMKDCSLMGSFDGVNWFVLNDVINNQYNFIDNTFKPSLVRYLKFYTASGHRNNNQLASIADIEAYEHAHAPFLSNLVASTGSLSPAFYGRNFNYSINVANSVNTIAFTPTAVEANMEIKVNGTAVASGVQSGQIPLTVGNNAIPVTVKSADGTMLTTYTINVTRAGSASYLKSLGIIEDNLELPVTLLPAFHDTQLNYTATVNANYSSVKVTPTTDDTSATIKVNGTVVPSGAQSGSIPLNIGSNTITIDLSSSGGGHSIYSVVITKTA